MLVHRSLLVTLPGLLLAVLARLAGTVRAKVRNILLEFFKTLQPQTQYNRPADLPDQYQ